MQRIFHTPEGVRDIYNGECSQKHHLQTEIRKVFDSYGYEEIETPSFEYFEVFSREVGTIPSKDLYKFFDREGNTLVLRPDFTPSVSRACATYFNPEHQVITLSYTGNTFINNSSYQGRLKETTQMGVERIGDDVRVHVFNTGKNIPEEDIPNIWQKFYKVDKARTREYGGNGIGLSIVKAIMDSYGKGFGVINKSNGVEFWFDLDGKAMV